MSSIVTAAITAGALIGYWQVDPPRDDPFKGVQATELRRELERKITESEARQNSRMMNIERTDETIQQTQREMWLILNDLPPDRWRRRIEALEIWIIKQDNSYEVPE